MKKYTVDIMNILDSTEKFKIIYLKK